MVRLHERDVVTFESNASRKSDASIVIVDRCVAVFLRAGKNAPLTLGGGTDVARVF